MYNHIHIHAHVSIQFQFSEETSGEQMSLDYSYRMFIELSTPVIQWLSYSPLDPRFAGSIPAGVHGFFLSVKILSMTSF